jgi:hypothetical protein
MGARIFCTQSLGVKMVTIILNGQLKTVLERDSINFLAKFIKDSINSLTVSYFNDGFEKSLELKSSNGLYLISGYDSSVNKLFTLRESVIEGEFEIGDGTWSGVYLTRDIEKVKKVFFTFIELRCFDGEILVCDSD